MVAFLILHVQKANQAAGAAEAGADGAAPPADDGPIDDGQGPMVQRGGGRLDNGRVEPRRPLASSALSSGPRRVVSRSDLFRVFSVWPYGGTAPAPHAPPSVRVEPRRKGVVNSSPSPSRPCFYPHPASRTFTAAELVGSSAG